MSSCFHKTSLIRRSGPAIRTAPHPSLVGAGSAPCVAGTVSRERRVLFPVLPEATLPRTHCTPGVYTGISSGTAVSKGVPTYTLMGAVRAHLHVDAKAYVAHSLGHCHLISHSLRQMGSSYLPLKEMWVPSHCFSIM